MDHDHYVKLRHPEELCAWEPRDGYALVTCRVMVLPESSHAPAVWESRSYEIRRKTIGWWINDPKAPMHETWTDVVYWLRRKQPADIELLTTV